MDLIPAVGKIKEEAGARRVLAGGDGGRDNLKKRARAECTMKSRPPRMAMSNWPFGRKMEAKMSCSSHARIGLQRRRYAVPIPMGRSFVVSCGSLNRARKRQGERQETGPGGGGGGSGQSGLG
jgi:hypothetical protein